MKSTFQKYCVAMSIIFTLISLHICLFCSSDVSAAQLKLHTEGQQYGVADLDSIKVSSSRSESGIYKIINCICPDGSTIGTSCGRPHATYNSLCGFYGNFVLCQVGCDSSAKHNAKSGDVWYTINLADPSTYIKIRYSRSNHLGDNIPIDIYLDNVFKASFQPINQGGWDNFTETDWIDVSPQVTLSGYVKDQTNAGIPDVTLSLSNDGGTVTTDSSGYYSKVVSCGWSGVVTPVKNDRIFAPVKRVYSNLSSVQISQDYIYTDTKKVEISIDEFDKDVADYYNDSGGNRGLMNQESIDFNMIFDGISSYTVTINNFPGNYISTWVGMWNSPIRNLKDNIPLDFRKLFGNFIKDEYQGKITGCKVMVKNVVSANPNLRLKVEFIKQTTIKAESFILSGLTYPHEFVFFFDPSEIGTVYQINWLIENAQKGDSVSIDYLRLIADVPVISTEKEAFLWSYANLMYNYDSQTGLIQDRSHFEFGKMENISATAKGAKISAFASSIAFH